MATKIDLLCSNCDSVYPVGSMFDTLKKKAEGHFDMCPQCKKELQIHFEFSFGMEVGNYKYKLLDCFLPDKPHQWQTSKGSVKWFPFLVVLENTKNNEQTIWQPYWHLETAKNGSSRRKYGQWAQVVEKYLFEDMLNKAKSKGYL